MWTRPWVLLRAKLSRMLISEIVRPRGSPASNSRMSKVLSADLTGEASDGLRAMACYRDVGSSGRWFGMGGKSS